MIAIRAMPGGGKNFIATLLSKYYNINNLIHYDEKFNEYSHSSYLIADDNGYIKHPFWVNNKWKILSSKPISNPKFVHEHEWVDDNSGIVRNFRLYNRNNGKIGKNPNEFYKKITEGFFIFSDDPEIMKFIFKLILIKISGQRPLIVYDDKYEISTSLQTLESDYLRTLGPVGDCNNLQRLIYSVAKNLTYDEWIDIWKKYCIFVKQFPYVHILSQVNIFYILDWLNSNKNFDLFDKNKFLEFFAEYKKDYNNRYYNNISLENDAKKLNQVRELQKENNMILHEINYRDLFFDFKPTNTILDNYMDEIKIYTERNIKLINDYESFYGKILLD